MPKIEEVTVPLVIHFPEGDPKVVAACFPHPKGVIYLDTFWHLSTPSQAAHLIHGKLKGEGPWRVGQHTIRVLGCHGSDPELQHEFTAWNQYLQSEEASYPNREQLFSIARKLGATI